MKKKKYVIITGCGRSGTLYMTKVFEIFGYNIGHEALNADGISSWYIVDEHRWNLVQQKMNPNREVVYIHLVRGPLAAMSSMYRCDKLRNRSGLNIFRRMFPKYTKMPELAFVAKYWVTWNKLAENRFDFDMRFRVEDVSSWDTVDKIASLIGIKPRRSHYREIHKLGDKVHEIPKKYLDDFERAGMHKVLEGITFGDIEQERPKLAEELRQMAVKYGYKIGGDDGEREKIYSDTGYRDSERDSLPRSAI